MALPHPPFLALQATRLPGCRCRAPFSGCICPLVLDTESWEEEGGSFCLATRKGSRYPGGRVGTCKEDPSLAGCFILVPSSPRPPPQLRVSSCVLDHASRCDAPFWARSCPPMQCEGHILLPIGPCPNSPPKRGGSSHTALFAAMRPPQQYPRGGPNAHCT